LVLAATGKEVQVIENESRRRVWTKGKWTEAIAVGSKEFDDATAERLGIREKGRQVIVENSAYELREPGIPYNSDFDPENGALSNENIYDWNELSEIST